MTNSHRFFRSIIVFGILAFIGAVIVAVAGFNAMQAQRSPVSAPASTETVSAQPGASDVYAEAEAFLVSLPVTSLAPEQKYEREAQFGRAWLDVDDNGCDTRNDILQRDFVSFETFRGDCEVQTGILNDPYTGKTIKFVHTNAFGKNTGDSGAVQIDHIIPLSWAWQNGADAWDQETRVLFANDPVNLKAVDGEQNLVKSDQGPSTWWPTAESYRCTYALEFTVVLQNYQLTIPAADKQALVDTLAGC